MPGLTREPRPHGGEQPIGLEPGPATATGAGAAAQGRAAPSSSARLQAVPKLPALRWQRGLGRRHLPCAGGGARGRGQGLVTQAAAAGVGLAPPGPCSACPRSRSPGRPAAGRGGAGPGGRIRGAARPGGFVDGFTKWRALPTCAAAGGSNGGNGYGVSPSPPPPEPGRLAGGAGRSPGNSSLAPPSPHARAALLPLPPPSRAEPAAPPGPRTRPPRTSLLTHTHTQPIPPARGMRAPRHAPNPFFPPVLEPAVRAGKGKDFKKRKKKKKSQLTKWRRDEPVAMETVNHTAQGPAPDSVYARRGGQTALT